MRVHTLLPLAGLASASASATKGCNVIKGALEQVYLPNSSVYEYEAQNFWSNTELMSPGCVFRPQTSAQLARGLEKLVAAEAKFAVRGGGHMGIRGSNNIDDGVLIVMSNLTTLELSADQSVLHLGPGFRWQQVYDFLEPYELAVPGGRLGPVGVPGLLLAGGISYYGNQVGFACDSVINYEVVLANGTIVEANATSHADLFWALKGGSSNFGLVTRFDIETLPSTKVWAGTWTVAEEYIPDFLAATAAFAANNTDPKTHIVPAVVPSADSAVGSVILFYDSPNVSYPDAFKPFTDIPAEANTMAFKTVAEMAREMGEVVTSHINDIFVAGTIKATTYDDLLQGVNIINATFAAQLPKLYAQIPTANISIIELDWQPIGAQWIDASNARGGNALGLNASEIYLCYAEVVEWIGSAYDEVVGAWVVETTELINNATDAVGLYDPFNYMGDAAWFQDIYGGYGAENVAKLQEIASAYDPEGVFQTLMPGGYKIF
ncbi:FAD-binding oxidoreductase [Aspergillus saccharolyticus JOP 1030-1]|uniref:FAD-binding domain-containing protein n=1 Tax=Aspergillus saccharolyticus JOP 1030-1 TaxID=1450539 RepID=A0A318Z1R8_9EURO|nr:FAD-binding domain-containing protein [Aspergillus saccharolyticus JOP 1030-1]PYH40334.1 FAD-binding domain-containing protein [Aspergillus saccharolyticus JOP 1030-1]